MFVAVKTVRRIAAMGVIAACMSASFPAYSADTTDPAAVEAARSLFAEGTAHFQAGRWGAALAALRRSHALVESPNTELMIARSLRELGRSVEAVTAFEQAAGAAGAKVAEGEPKYAPTKRAAEEEGRKLRATLGSIRVRVAKRPGLVVIIDGRPVTLDAAGEATVLHPPGNATVFVSDASGAEQRQALTVVAGSTVELEFAADASPRALSLSPNVIAPAEPTPAAEPRASTGSWAVPAAIATGVLTLAGTGIFVGFGSDSRAKYDALDARCGPSSCGPAERAEADAGERSQVIANVGLAVAGVAAVATIAFVVVALTSPGRL